MKHFWFAIPLVIILALMFIFTSCGKNETVETKDEQEVKETSADASTYKIDLNASKVEWLGKKVTGQHNGTVDIKSGELNVENGELEGGKFVIDFNTIKVLDLEDPESNAKLTNHLKSEDFFSAEKHPEAIFEITSLEKADDGKGNNYKVNGNLTIKGIAKNISFPANINVTDNKVTATADFNLDRTEWDIRYGSGKFFENIGDKAINDDFNIKFDITADNMQYSGN